MIDPDAIPKTPSYQCEYDIEFVPTPIDEVALKARLNQLGSQGWHLMFVTWESIFEQQAQNGLRLWLSRDL